MMTMLCWRRRASSSDCRATATGSPTPLPGSGAYTGTPARSPSTWSCCTALGRCRSAATISGVLPCPLSHSASLAASVVLPEPCRPASMMTVGGTLANRSRLVSPPRMPTSSSCTILMTCCAGFSAAETSSPLARSLTRAMNCLTTGSATSASSRAMRISRVVASMSAADSRPRPRSAEKTCVNRSDRVSNTLSRLPAVRESESCGLTGQCRPGRNARWPGAAPGRSAARRPRRSRRTRRPPRRPASPPGPPAR